MSFITQKNRKSFSTDQTKKDIITVCKLIHSRGFVAATDGNVSARINDNRFIITPSGFNKGLIEIEDLVTINDRGEVIEGNSKASSEVLMHLRVYEMRKDVDAVIHAHPPYLTAFSIAGRDIPQDILPEVVLTLGYIPTSEYATPSTPGVADVIQPHIKDHDAICLKRHGSLTLGDNIFSAYNRLEKLEHAARIAVIANSLGDIKPLDEDSLEKLTSLAHKLGIRKYLKPADK